MANKKTKLLFVCLVNRHRSKTAEDLFSDSYDVKSCGLDKESDVQVTRELLEWADIIFVMEKSYRNKLQKLYPDLYPKKKIKCLYIEDVYNRGDPELEDLLKERVERLLSKSNC